MEDCVQNITFFGDVWYGKGNDDDQKRWSNCFGTFGKGFAHWLETAKQDATNNNCAHDKCHTHDDHAVGTKCLDCNGNNYAKQCNAKQQAYKQCLLLVFTLLYRVVHNKLGDIRHLISFLFVLLAKVCHVQACYNVHNGKDNKAVPHTIGNGYTCVLGCKANGKWVCDSRCKANAGSHQNKTDGGKLGPVHCCTKHCQKWIKYQQLLLKSKHSGKHHHHQSDCPNGNKALGVQLLDDKAHKGL